MTHSTATRNAIQCPARIASLIQADIGIDAETLAARASLRPSTAKNYLNAFHHGRIRDDNWRCELCGRREADARRHAISSICVDCRNDVRAKGKAYCVVCHEAKPISETRRHSKGTRCLQCVPRINAQPYVLDEPIMAYLRSHGTATIKALMAATGASHQHVLVSLRRLQRTHGVIMDRHAYPYVFSLKKST